MNKSLLMTLAAGTLLVPAAFADRESSVAERLDASADVLSDMMHAPDKGIPQDLVSRAQCIVVIPNIEESGIYLGRQIWARLCRVPSTRWLRVDRASRDAD